MFHGNVMIIEMNDFQGRALFEKVKWAEDFKFVNDDNTLIDDRIFKIVSNSGGIIENNQHRDQEKMLPVAAPIQDGEQDLLNDETLLTYHSVLQVSQENLAV